MATYEWTTDKNGNQHYRRSGDGTRVQRISEANPPAVVTSPRAPKGGEMVIEAPDEPVAAEVELTPEPVEAPLVESAPVVVPAKAPAKRRSTRAKK